MIKIAFLKIQTLWKIQFIRFLVVGGINTLFGYAVFALLILLQIDYRLAVFISTICGVLFNFKTTGSIVFANRRNRLLFKFVGVYTVTYLLNIGLLRLLSNYGIKNLEGGALIALPIAIVAYFLNKFIVFSEKGTI